MALAWWFCAIAIAVYEWRRPQRTYTLQLTSDGWIYSSPPNCEAQLVSLSPQQWIYGPLLLLSIRLPGQRLPKQLWICRDALPPGEYCRLCRALMLGLI